jgi:hypothetical protein
MELMASLESACLGPKNVMACFKKTGLENRSFGGGQLIHT